MSKRNGVHVAICICLIVIIWSGYFFAKHYGTDRVFSVIADDFSWVYQIDSIESGDKIVLRGFAFEVNADATKEAYEIVLQDISSEKRYFPKMEYYKREDINNYFSCEYDYLYSGFEASIKKSQISLEDSDYEVLLKKSGTQIAYHTGTYISDGKLVYVNPEEYRPLEVAGTDIEEVVRKGILRVYRPDAGAYVYQYNGELYWIVDSTYRYVGEYTYMHYQVETTQIDKLPERMLEKGWTSDDLGFVFVDKELPWENIGEYHVAKVKLPTDYSITRILTGDFHVDKWLWHQYFRPYFEFN